MVGNRGYLALERESLEYIDEDVGTAWNEDVAESHDAGEYDDERGERDDEREDGESEYDESGDERGDNEEDADGVEERSGGEDECEGLDEEESGADDCMEGDEEYAGDEKALACFDSGTEGDGWKLIELDATWDSDTV